MDLAEVYRVIYDGPDDYLQGAIMSLDEESGRQYLYAEKNLDRKADVGIEEVQKYLNVELYTDSKKKLKMPLIKAREQIMLNGPAKASICAIPGFTLTFCLFGVFYKNINVDFPGCEPYKLSAPLYKVIMSRNCKRRLTVLYAIFENAAEAHVKVKLTNVNSAFNLYGTINASTSAIKHTAYSSLLFFKNKDEPHKIMKERPRDEIFIPLSRPFVAVPLESDLILEISLHTDDNEEIFDDVLTFTAKEGVPSSKFGPKKCSKGEIEVEVSWRYKSLLDQLIEQEKAMSSKEKMKEMY